MEGLVRVAKEYLGFPSMEYKSPGLGNSKKGFDCSGFVQFILKGSEIKIPKVPDSEYPIRHCNEFFDYFGLLVHEEVKKPGDLFFVSKNGLLPTHMGIYIGEGKIIHSPGLDGKVVEIRSLEDFREGPQFNSNEEHLQLYVQNPIGYKRVAVKEGRYQNVI